MVYDIISPFVNIYIVFSVHPYVLKCMGKTAEYFTVILEHYIIYSMQYNENYCEIKVCKSDFMGLFNICEFTQCYLS